MAYRQADLDLSAVRQDDTGVPKSKKSRILFSVADGADSAPDPFLDGSQGYPLCLRVTGGSRVFPHSAQRSERTGVKRESEPGLNAHGCFDGRQAYTAYWYIIEHPHSTAALPERRSP